MDSGVAEAGELPKLRCFICFGAETGKRWEDHFVATQNGHAFHYCCIRYMMIDGSSICPVCDEDLQHQTLLPIPIPGSSPPADSPRSEKSSHRPAFPKRLSSSLMSEVTGFFRGSKKTFQEQEKRNGKWMVYSMPMAGSPGNGGPTPERTNMIERAANPSISQSQSISRVGDQINGTAPSAPHQNNIEALPNSQFRRIDPSHLNIRDHMMGAPDFLTRMSPDYTFKIAILGDASVGKSSLLRRFADEAFDSNIRSTIGCDLRVRDIEIANKIIRLNLWDTAGQERHRQALVGSYLRNTDGILMCYDITEICSLVSIQEWNDFAVQYAPPEAVKLLVGNKLDLWDRRTVQKHHAAEIAELLNSPYIFCSAKSSSNIESVFKILASQILEKRLAGRGVAPRRMEGVVRLTVQPKHKKKDCC